MFASRKSFRWLLLFACLFWGCASGRQQHEPETRLRSQRVQTMMVEIASALDQYHADHGSYPNNLATLRNEAYLSIMPDLERDWFFSFVIEGERIQIIKAVSQVAMADGAGYSILYGVPDNFWEGYGITVWPK